MLGKDITLLFYCLAVGLLNLSNAALVQMGGEVHVLYTDNLRHNTSDDIVSRILGRIESLHGFTKVILGRILCLGRLVQ